MRPILAIVLSLALGAAACAQSLVTPIKNAKLTGDVQLVNSSSTWKFTIDTASSMSAGELLLTVPTGQADNVLALRNEWDQQGRISGLTLRYANDREGAAFGVGNRGSGSIVYPFVDCAFIETSKIFGVGGPTFAPDFKIVQTHRDGSSNIKWMERLRFEDQGNITFFKNDSVWPSQTAMLTLDMTNTRVRTDALELFVNGTNASHDPLIIEQDDTAGSVSIAFRSAVNTNKFAIGYGQSGFGSPYTSSAYLVSVGSGGTMVPLKFVQYDGTTANVNLSLDSSGKILLGSGATPISKVLSAAATLDFGSTSAQTSSDLTITVTGAAVGDIVAIGVPNGSVSANSSFTAWVSATNTVTVRFNNYSSGAIDPASGSFRASVVRF